MDATSLSHILLVSCPDLSSDPETLLTTALLRQPSLLANGVDSGQCRMEKCKRYVKSGGIRDRLAFVLCALRPSPWVDVIRNRRGVSALEFALVAPVLFMLVFGIIQFGITFNNYLALTDGVRAASRVLAASRSSPTPFTSATNAIYASAPNLTKGSVTITLSVAGANCASDGGCATALTAAAGGTASVQASYPCNLTILGVDYAPQCTLTSVTTERVE